jgi:hypothetical protein
MFYSDTQSFLNFLTILNRLEVGVFDRAVKFHSSCIKISTVGQKKQGHASTRLLKSTELKSLDGWIEQTSSHVVWRVVGEHGTNEYALHSNLC